MSRSNGASSRICRCEVWRLGSDRSCPPRIISFNFNVDLGPVLKFEHLAKLHSADQLKVFWPMEHASFVSVRSHECPDGFRCDQACHVVAGPSGEIARPGSGTGELRSVAARRKTATRGAGTHGGRTVTRNYRRAVESVLEGYGIEKSSVSRQFVAASSNQLRVLCERRLEDLNLVVLMIDGIHFGGQVLVVALGIAESGKAGERHKASRTRVEILPYMG
jgi:hypothetical protein